MPVKHDNRTSPTSHHLLDDGRRVTVRRAVPVDAPALSLLDADIDCVGGLVALDDRGAIVGYAGVAAGVAVVDGWSGSGLAALLADSSGR
jgi:hypothetical protein